MKDPRLDESITLMSRVNYLAAKKYYEKQVVKGDSWRDMKVLGLYEILLDEVAELKEAMGWYGEGNSQEILEECLDVINMCKMVGARLAENLSEANKQEPSHSIPEDTEK